MSHETLELTRHYSVLRRREEDAVVGIVAGLIVDYLKGGHAEGGVAGYDTVSPGAADMQEVQK